MSRIYIVGAGPGSADLLTVRAANLLRAAQVVLHDDLVPHEVLALCSADAELVNVGKRCGQSSRSQEQINALMVWYARETQTQTIVRLKSGDPAVFGRLGEELSALRRAEVEFEIVPGVTAASAAASAAGITLTDRNAASALLFMTAHNIRGEKMNLAGFDPRRTTLAIYMPGPDYSRTARELREAGVDARMPCLLVSNAGRSNEQKCFLPLQDLPFASGVKAPALLIVGVVARHLSPEMQDDICEYLHAAAVFHENHDPDGVRVQSPVQP